MIRRIQLPQVVSYKIIYKCVKSVIAGGSMSYSKKLLRMQVYTADI